VSVRVRLIGENSTDTQLIPTHIYLHARTLALTANHTHTQNSMAISIDIFIFDSFVFDIFTFGVIQVNLHKQRTLPNTR